MKISVPRSNQNLLNRWHTWSSPHPKKMTLWWGDIKKQKGSDDCGLFAIAVATYLAFGILPEECSWNKMPCITTCVNASKKASSHHFLLCRPNELTLVIVAWKMLKCTVIVNSPTLNGFS